jgi:hypothetical protein
MRKLLRRLPLQFRVLYRQFLLRVVDLESLSMQADIPRLLGQFAGVLLMFSLVWGIGFMAATDHPGMTRAGATSWYSLRYLCLRASSSRRRLPPRARF